MAQIFRISKLSSDIAWTGASFCILAASGIIINIAILALRDASALGVFNQSYAVYIIASQFAVGGMHYSTLRAAAELDKNDAAIGGQVLVSALLPGTVLAVLVGILMWFLGPAIGRSLGSPDVGEAIRIMAASMPLFAVSKIVLGYLNGLRRMRAFAALQAVRYIVLAGVVVACGASSWESQWMALGFPAAELVTMCCGLGYIVGAQLACSLSWTRTWIVRHVSFSSRAFLSGVLIEANSKIDVLVAGYFLSDRAVGIYAFVAMIFEGLLQLLTVVRTNFNPLLVTALEKGCWDDTRRLRTISGRFVMPAASLLAALAITGLWIIATWLLPTRGLDEGLVASLILFGSLPFLSVLMPFDQLLLLNGYPGHQSMQYLTIAIVGLVGTMLLVPVFGIEGAAAGLTMGYLAGAAYLVVCTRRFFGWDLITNKKARA